MRFNWTFLPTVTIDLTGQKASDVPPWAYSNRRLIKLFCDELRGGGACGGHTVLDG